MCQSGIVILDGGHLFGHVQLLFGRQLEPVAILDAQHSVVVIRIVVIVDVLMDIVILEAPDPIVESNHRKWLDSVLGKQTLAGL